MKKILTIVLVLMLAFSLVACSEQVTSSEEIPQSSEVVSSSEELVPEVTPVDFNIAGMKGPTTMGMMKLMTDNEEGKNIHNYNVSIYGTPDEIATGLVKGEIDVAAVPCNLASVLYNKTQGALQVSAINTLSVLYVVQTGDSVKTVEDLKGKTIYSTGKGTTPEYVLNYILAENGLEVGKDVQIEYKSESTEVAAILSESDDMIAVLPQPYVSSVLMQNDKISVALDLTKEWDKISTDSALVTGVVVARKEFIDSNKDAFNQFLSDYKTSTQYINENIDQAANLAVKYEIVGAEPIAKMAIPQCSITYIDGEEMRENISGYLEVLYNQEPNSIGGALPDEEFYYTR